MIFSLSLAYRRVVRLLLVTSLLAATLAGLIPPPLVRIILPAPAAEFVEAALPSTHAVQAAPASAALAQAVSGSNVLTITKTVNGVGSGPFNVTVTGSNGYNNATTVSPGTPTVLTGLVGGVYTVTEASPGAGWTTSYAVTSGTGTASSNNAVVTLQNANTAPAFTLPALTSSALASDDFASNSYSGGTGWSGSWVEDESNNGAGTSDGTAAGNVRIVSDAGNNVAQIFNEGRSLTRAFVLPTNSCTVSLSFSYRAAPWTTINASATTVPFLVDISTDGGVTYGNLLTLSNAITTSYQIANVALPALAGSTLRLRWRTTNTFAIAATEGYYLDNVAVATQSGPLCGTVFHDFNSDGQIGVSSGPGTVSDIGVSGVTATAYDKNGNSVGSATSATDGTYTINPSTAGPYRVVFSNLPAGYEPTTHGTGNGTSVQFVTTAAGSNVNLGLNAPEEYCQNNPSLCTTVQANGDSSWITPTLALEKFAYTASGGSPPPTTIATKAQIGSTWGVAYARDTKTIYSAAFVKRHAGLGPNGLGAIYQTDVNGASTSLFVDMATLGASLGSVPSNAARGLGASSLPNNDAAVYPLVGKVGLGDIDLSADSQTLYVTSLNDKTLYAVNVGSPLGAATLAGSYPIPDPGCVGGAWRPFGLKVYRGNVYVGGICDAQTSQAAADLHAYIYRFAPGPNTFTPIFTFALNYPKGQPYDFSALTGWYAWTDTFPAPAFFANYIRPQPVLSDIEFDVNGDMILGFADRFSHQTGANNYPPTGTNQEFGFVGGDILRACASGAGTYVLESNGACGSATSAGVNNAEGPGGGEFYYQDINYEADGSPGHHHETSEGGLALLAGSGEIALTAMDPSSIVQGGVDWMSNSTGARTDSYVVYTGETPLGLFGKAGGMGDLELLCDAAPLEIGNRVWDDLNGNGVQDPGEPGLNGLTVSRQGPTNTVTTVTSGDGNYYFNNLLPSTPYTLTLTPPSGYSVTSANATALSGAGVTSNHAISDTIDSDASLVGSVARILYTTGRAGENNHGLDFGFTQPVSGRVGIVNTAPGAIQVSKQVATSDGSSPTVSGSFTINVNCGGANISPSSQTVAAGGSVTFSNIPAGSSCSVSESTGNLPAAPSGYVWVAHQVTPGQVTVVAGATTSVTVRNTLAPQPAASGVLTVTKTISGTGSGPFNVTITGPNGYNNATTISPGTPLVLTGLAQGVYTVTEASPGAGWVTTYTVNGVSNITGGVVNLSSSSVTPFAAALITGTVYQDYNNNGQMDITGSAAIDVGVSGVTVTAYGTNGNACGSTASGANGTYTFTPTCPGPWRLVFTTLPTGYQPSTHGSQNGTSVQFVTDNSVAARVVNFAIERPSDYNLPSSQVINAIHSLGAPTATAASANFPAIVGNAFSTRRNTQFFDGFAVAQDKVWATFGQVGAVYGLAYSQNRNEVYAGAYMRRAAGFGNGNKTDGTGSTGAIYRISTAGTVSVLLDIDPASPTNPNPALYSTGPNPHPTNSTDYFRDPAFFEVGKLSWGDLSLSADEQTLYAVNMFDRQLYVINATSGAILATVKIPGLPGGAAWTQTTCTNNPELDLRPMGVKAHNGKVYVGVICSAESTQVHADLTGYVMVYDPVVGSFSSTPAVSFPMWRANGAASPTYLYDPSLINGILDTRAWWNGTPLCDPHVDGVCTDNQVNRFDYNKWLQKSPIVSDVDFDGDDMVLGIRIIAKDQHAMQGTFLPYPPGPPSGFTANDDQGISGANGRLVRACLSGGVYTIENNGVCGGKVGYGVNSPPYAYGTGQVTYYIEQVFHDNGDYTGANAVFPGAAVAVGATPGYNAEGIVYIDAATKNVTRQTSGPFIGAVESLNIIRVFSASNLPLGFAKLNGLGDVELMTVPAPIEIGNRVWNDLDGDGMQDAGEPGLSGVTVSRQGPTNTVTTVTAGDGNYYFNTLLPNTQYTLTINVPSGYSLTAANAAALNGAGVSSNHAISDTIDSDAALIGGQATIYYTTASAGQNNHGLDFGFTQPVQGQVEILNTPPVAISYALSKTHNTPDPVRVGDDITFTIRITNTGSTPITTLPLRDLYDVANLFYLTANVLPDDSLNDGQLDWSDLTASFGQDLAPGQSLAVTTVFVARSDTTFLPGGATVNTARVLITPTTTVSAPVRIEAPTAVTLANRHASYELGKGGTLAWSTVSEVEVVGFHLLRRELGSNTGWVRLTDELIPAQQPGQATGASYRFVDETVAFGQSYLYLLELVDRQGQTTRRELGVVVAGSQILLPVIAR